MLNTVVQTLRLAANTCQILAEHLHVVYLIAAFSNQITQSHALFAVERGDLEARLALFLTKSKRFGTLTAGTPSSGAYGSELLAVATSIFSSGFTLSAQMKRFGAKP